jgi:hypothetical protein
MVELTSFSEGIDKAMLTGLDSLCAEMDNHRLRYEN